ncbi:excalibur calcium-binding domain-containing protein [Shewanella xiamenensis]|uniref:excalibur calcium-binding domain-containing protein n=1 Tax=Shewanella TaxID=22 RepID=UPI00217D0647|nr:MULTISPECIES: excalibur calcium-binding domain-containing protein [Shewanella]MCT8860487.1 excalibur calcium-binding domain-containing protein [Shewanella xiamenensis]MDN5500090.1 excalibur calcium-binding domain-containing protein [Shewanella sp.]MDN5530018.1 excalibur calcium-binding domain-containing protein [Shewanella sp.]UWG64130.1 excalibur calcium-binding domain-containing protein [Shewanella xiamenensis]
MFRQGTILAFAICMNGCSDSGSQEDINCDSFSTQSEAQIYYKKYNAKQLDKDNDGIACEHLPKNSYPLSKSHLEDFAGSYNLLGEICTENNCEAQVVTLEVDSDNYLELCLLDGVDSNCAKKQLIKINSTEIDNGILFFEGGNIQFGTIESGHVKLNLNNIKYYGHLSLNTNYSESGYYYENGIVQKQDGSFQLSSNSGRIVSWNKLNGLSVISD